MERPDISEIAFVAPGARIIGNVKLDKNSSVWHNAVIRGDMARITVGEGSNIQDNCTLHCDMDLPLLIGCNVSVGHNAVLHSCDIGSGSLIGMGAVLLSGSKVGRGCIVAAGAVVTEGTSVPDGCLYIGIPAAFKRWLTENEKTKLLYNANAYVKLIDKYKNKYF